MLRMRGHVSTVFFTVMSYS